MTMGHYPTRPIDTFPEIDPNREASTVPVPLAKPAGDEIANGSIGRNLALRLPRSMAASKGAMKLLCSAA